MKKSKLLADVAAARRTSGLNQSEFWSRFGRVALTRFIDDGDVAIDNN